MSSLISQDASFKTCLSPSFVRRSCATIFSSSQLQKALVLQCFLLQNYTISVMARLLELYLSMLFTKCYCWLYTLSRLRTTLFSPPQLLRAVLRAFERLSSAAVGFLIFLSRKCQQCARITWSMIYCLIYYDYCKYSTKCASLISMHFLRLFIAPAQLPCAIKNLSSSRKTLAKRYQRGVCMIVCFTFQSLMRTFQSRLLLSWQRASKSIVRTNSYRLDPYFSTHVLIVERYRD